MILLFPSIIIMFESMNLKEFSGYISKIELPVVLLEGTRKVSLPFMHRQTVFAQLLSEKFPRIIFRSGNASGTDEAFMKGVFKNNPLRIQHVLPGKGTGRWKIPEPAFIRSFEEITSKKEITRIVNQTIDASPSIKQLIEHFYKTGTRNNLYIKSLYLLRDTLKVLGSEQLGLAKTSAGIFFVNPENPNKGGTAHTIRVCIANNIPVIVQSEWKKWFS